MTVQAVRAALAQFGHGDDVLEFTESSATVAEAAAAIGTEPEHIAKSIAVYGADGATGGAIIIVAAGDAKLGNGDFKRTFGFKPHMVAREDVERLTGHPVGGVCPFANPADTAVYLDESLRRFERVWPACGSTNSAIGLSLAELERCSEAKGWVDVCKGWRQEPDPH